MIVAYIYCKFVTVVVVIVATMLDVSRKVGVCKSTVSRVLNGKGRVSENTRKAIFRAVEELDYRPNVIAQSLSTQETNTIGLIVPRGYNMSQYITELIDITQELANSTKKFLMITQIDGTNLDDSINAIKNLADRRCDGILYYKSSYIDSEDAEEKLNKLIEDLPIPLVILNYKINEKPNNCVWFDHVSTGQLPVEYLLKHGHRNIAYISGPMNSNTSRARRLGYEQALSNFGIPINPLLIVETDGNFKGGYHSCNELIERGINFSAICCYNDIIAIGAMKALRQQNISIPHQVTLFGFDNEDVLDYIESPISSVHIPADKFVHRAGDLLFAHMTDKNPIDISQYEIRGELVIRE